MPYRPRRQSVAGFGRCRCKDGDVIAESILEISRLIVVSECQIAIPQDCCAADSTAGHETPLIIARNANQATEFNAAVATGLQLDLQKLEGQQAGWLPTDIAEIDERSLSGVDPLHRQPG